MNTDLSQPLNLHLSSSDLQAVFSALHFHGSLSSYTSSDLKFFVLLFL